MTVLLRSPCRGPGGQHVNKLSGLLAVLCGEHGIWQLLPLERPLPPVSLLPRPLPLPPLLVYRFPRAGPGSQPPGRFSCLCTQPCGRLTCVRPSATVCADARVPVCRRHCPELRGAGAGAPGARLRGLCWAPPPSALGLLSGSLPLSFRLTQGPRLPFGSLLPHPPHRSHQQCQLFLPRTPRVPRPLPPPCLQQSRLC